MSPFRSVFFPVFAWYLFVGPLSAENDTVGTETAGALDFNREVLPILSDKCFHCHGPDASTREAELRFDLPNDPIDTGVIVPGDPDASEMISRIFETDPNEIMPPPGSHRELTDDQKNILRRWVGEGAKYEQHWAFVSPALPELPKVSNPAWSQTALDRFILARLDQEGLAPAPAAPPETWYRRAHLDLLGLPPTIEGLDRFLADQSTHGDPAFERAVDQMLASPHFGERLAIDWLDVSRYADTHGFNNDSARSMWRWRDWVIDAFNQNLPYDRFLTEQLAGDLLPEPTLGQRIATGFNRNHVISSEGGIINEEYRVEYVADRVRTVGIAWMGLTLECARCHDHKYDPLPQSEYYSLFSFFNNVPEVGEDGRIANAAPLMRAPSPEQAQRIVRLDKQLAKERGQLDRELASWKPDAQTMALAADLLPKTSAIPALFLSAAEAEPSETDVWKPINPGPVSAPGVVGNSWQFNGLASVLIPGDQLKRSPRKPITISLWVRPDGGSADDVALLSSIDYSGTTEGTDYGRGFELRLAGEEMVFTLSKRFPAYSLRTASQGARIESGKWTHLAAVFEGFDIENQGDSLAHRVRLYVNGREQDTRVLNDGLFESVAVKDDKPSNDIRLGGDVYEGSAGFSGRLDQIRIWTTDLSGEAVGTVVAGDALARPGLLEDKQFSGSAIAIRSLYRSLVDADWAVRENAWNERAAERHQIERSASTLMVMEELPEARQAFVLNRGMYDQRGEPVSPAVPVMLGIPLPEGAPKNRLGLARWLTLPEHPLTARVVVNRFWQHMFGVGLVRTPENFGFQGEYPTHPELLDWLAVTFVESGWDVKALFRDWVLSATYRQSSQLTPDLREKDPENRLLARMSRVRLPAEIVRDQALAVSDLLVTDVGGPSVYPAQPEGYLDNIVVDADYPGTKWLAGTGEDLYRRSLYTFWKRTAPHPAMLTFDAPDREFCIARRSVTTTPLQTLVLWNEPSFVESSQSLARQLIGNAASLETAFRQVTGRNPNPAEANELHIQWREIQASWKSDREAALAFSGASESTDPVELASWTSIASMLLSLDETITRP